MVITPPGRMELLRLARDALSELSSQLESIPREQRSPKDCLCVVGCRQMVSGANRLIELMEAS